MKPSKTLNCQQVYTPSAIKIREMQLNESVAAEIGRFFLEHQHDDDPANVELVSDSPATNWDELKNYRKQTKLDTGK